MRGCMVGGSDRVGEWIPAQAWSQNRIHPWRHIGRVDRVGRVISGGMVDKSGLTIC